MQDNLVIMPIAPQDTLVLRQALLRPHLTPETCVYPGDDTAGTTHLGAFIRDDMVGIVSVYQENLPDDDRADGYRFRALAIIDSQRGRGFGLALLNAAEKLALERGAGYLWANARSSALGFYLKAGYEVGDREFIVAGVGPHRIVRRELAGVMRQ